VQRSFRYYYLRIIRQAGSPEQIAGGMALGVCMAFLAPPGVQVVLALVLASLVKLNRIAAALGCLVTNPLTWPFVIYVQLVLGGWITGTAVPTGLPTEGTTLVDYWRTFVQDFHSSIVLLRAFLVGAATTAVVATVAAYYATLYVVNAYRRRKQRREAARAAAAAAPEPPTPHAPPTPPPPPCP
jgi:uncharacterized protein (DUF2062 family)